MHKSLVVFFNSAIYGSIFFILFIVDFILGNGFVDMFQRLFCKITCFVKKTIREEAKVQITGLDNPMNLPVLFAEIFLLSLTVAVGDRSLVVDLFFKERRCPLPAIIPYFPLRTPAGSAGVLHIHILNKYKQFRGTDRIDELLQESKDALRETNEFLEKWRLRRINWQQPSEYSYLDEEPQEIKPLKLEIPILHMAIIDALGTSRNQSERGDAGDAYNITDSTCLSVYEEDMEYPEPVTQSSKEQILTCNSRYLWDVAEEDDNNLDDILL